MIRANQDNPEYNPPQYDRGDRRPDQPGQYTPLAPEQKPDKHREDRPSQTPDEYHPSEKQK